MTVTWIIAAAVGLALFCVLLLLYGQVKLKNKINDLSDLVKVVSDKVELSDDASRGLGAALEELRNEVAELGQRATAPEDNSEESILKARGLLESGLENKQIAEQCGLSLEEVNLMDAMRRSKLVELEPEKLS